MDHPGNKPALLWEAEPPSTGFPYTLAPLLKATRAYYPDDPSNVYHSYINDHVKFRILHGGRDVTHVHHQHAHQWLQSPNSDESSYLDSQMISPGASYTLEMVYNGSGNRNKVVGDSIFHCHFYPHFAAGMWAMWRTHDVFEAAHFVYPQGTEVDGPDVTNPLASPGFHALMRGLAGARAPHPPLDFAKDQSGLRDGGLPRHVVTGGAIKFESHSLTDWSKDLATMSALQLPEEGTKIEQAAMAYFGQRCYPTSLPDGTLRSCPSSNSTPPQSTLLSPPTGFVLNGLPRKNPAGNAAEQLGAQAGAPFADPAITDNGLATGTLRRDKAPAIQLDVTFNKSGRHYPQQRMLTLWADVAPTLKFQFGNPSSGRKPEPLFFRANTGDIIEYWHTNLVPNYYQLDAFQVRTPTVILSQHC